jgi:hypothetical protein
MLVLLFCVAPTTSPWCYSFMSWSCYFVLVLLFCVGVTISHVGCATSHIGVIISCWCYYFSHWYYCFALVVVLHIDAVASRIGVASSCCCCYFMLVLLLCNSQVPFGLHLVVVNFELVVMPVCTASYMMAGYRHARHIF